MSLQTAEKQSTQLKQYLQVMAGLERLNLAQEKECLCKMASGDEDSRRRLVESYLPRVVAWAGEFRGGALRFEELIELGNQALVVAGL